MRATVIVVTFNHRAHIERCLRSVMRTLGPSDDLVVVDNSSSDGTPELLRSAFPSVRVITNPVNRGFGAACNQAAGQSRSEFLVFLNPDTETCPGWLDPLLSMLDSEKSAGLSTPTILLRQHPDRIDAFGHDVHISGLATCRGWGEPPQSHPVVEEVAAVSGACFAIRRSLFGRLDGFDERLFLYYEDDDLSLRARLAGFTCYAVPASRVLHDHKPGFAPDKLRYLERNRLWTTLKVYRRGTLLRLVPVLIGAELLGWGLACMSGPGHMVAKLRAWWELWCWLPELARARRRVQRAVPDKLLLQAHSPHLAFAQVSDGRAARGAERVAEAAFAMFAPR